jgi:hypothetical protein
MKTDNFDSATCAAYLVPHKSNQKELLMKQAAAFETFHLG